MDFRADGIGHAEFCASGLGAMQVVVIDTVPVTVCGTAAHIAQADPDLAGGRRRSNKWARWPRIGAVL